MSQLLKGSLSDDLKLLAADLKGFQRLQEVLSRKRSHESISGVLLADLLQ